MHYSVMPSRVDVQTPRSRPIVRASPQRLPLPVRTSRQQNKEGRTMRAPCLLLLGVLIALPSLAGTAYIPFVAQNLPGADTGRSTTVDVEIYNQGTVGR